MNFTKYYKNKKVLITGHTGFKGAWLTLWLIKCGAKIMGLSNNTLTKPSIFKVLKIKKKISHVNCDIRNIKKLENEILNFKPDFVFHFAAQALVKKSFLEPYNTWTTNSLGTINVLEVLRRNNFTRKITAVIITSDKSYKNIEKQKAYIETDTLGGSDPYSASKASAELALKSYVDSFLKKKKDVLVGIARAGNVIGGGDWSDDRLVPDCIKSWSQKKSVVIRNPKSTRPWQHVLEAIRGYLIFGIKLKNNRKLDGEVFNFGPNNKLNHNVEDLVKKIKIFWKNIKWIVKPDKLKLESNLLKINSNKAKKKLNWQCILTFSETAEYVSKWYINYFNKHTNMFDYSLEQISSYEKKIRSKN